MKRPRKRLNFNSHGSPVTIFSSHAEDTVKASMKTPLVARQGNYILELTDLEKVLIMTMQSSTSHSQAGVSTSGNDCPFWSLCLLGNILRHIRTLSSLSHRALVRRCSQSMASQKNNDTRACLNRSGTTGFQILIFCVVVSHSFPSFHSLRHHALLGALS